MRRFLFSIVLSVAYLVSSIVHASELEQANQLISEGKNAEAFELLEPLEFDLSGDETFDILFGYAALEAGHTSLATLAFERVLAVNPDNNTARFHLARAYFMLSDFDGARREFEMLLSLNPTAGIRETVGQYLDAIAARKPQAKTNYTGRIALGVGYDSNVTGGTSNNPVFFPGLNQDYQLSASEVEADDRYSLITAGMDLVHRLSEANSIYAGGDLNKRAHNDFDNLDYLIASLRAGYQHAFSNQSIRTGLTLGHLQLDGDPFQDSDSIELEWRNTLEERIQVGVVGTYSRYRHRSSADEVSDFDDSNLNFSILRVLGKQGDKLISAALGIGHENDLNDRADGNSDYLKLSLTGQIQFSDTKSGFLLISLRDKDYDRENILFSKKRSESQITLIAGLVFNVGRSYSIRTTAVLSDTNSNFSLYDSSRNDISVTFRKDFL